MCIRELFLVSAVSTISAFKCKRTLPLQGEQPPMPAIIMRGFLSTMRTASFLIILCFNGWIKAMKLVRPMVRCNLSILYQNQPIRERQQILQAVLNYDNSCL
jgi:hypothetical protein